MFGTDFPLWLLLPALWLGFVGAMMLLVFVVGMFETLMVWNFAPEDGARRPPATFDPADPYAPSAALAPDGPAPPSGYAAGAADEAGRLGLARLGTFRDPRGGMYRTRYEFWLTPERDALALIADGTIARLPFRTIKLYTRRADGSYLVSLDDQRGAGFDPSGQTDEGLDPGAPLPRLLDWHRRRIAAGHVPAVPFAEADPLVSLREYRYRQAEFLERAGLITFRDSTRDAYRFTPLGSAHYTIRMHARGYRRRFWPDTRRKLPPVLPTAASRGVS